MLRAIPAHPLLLAQLLQVLRDRRCGENIAARARGKAVSLFPAWPKPGYDGATIADAAKRWLMSGVASSAGAGEQLVTLRQHALNIPVTL